MARNKFLRQFFDFSGGLSEVANDNMRDNELVEAMNIVPGDSFGISRCTGTDIAYSQIPGGGKVVRVIELHLANDTQTLGFTTNDFLSENIYLWNEEDETWYPFTEDSETVATFANGGQTDDSTSINVDDGSIFSEGDIIHNTTSGEKMLVTEVNANELTVLRGHLGTTPTAVGDDDVIKLASVLSIDPIKSYFIYAYKLYWLDGIKFQMYDGTNISSPTLTYLGEPPLEWQTSFQAKIDAAVGVVRRNTRWFYVTGADELIPSEIGDPLKFKPDAIINITTQDGDVLTAVTTLNRGLLIWKKHSVHYLTGYNFELDNDIEVIQLNVDSGTRFPETIKTIDNGVLFLGNDGIYKLYITYLDVVATKNLSRKKVANRLGKEVIRARAEVMDGVYYLSLDQKIDGEVVNREFRYYINDQAYFGEFTQGVYSYAIGLNDSDKLFIGSNNGYILYYNPDSYHYIDTGTGDIMDIPILAKTKGYDVVGSMFQDAGIKRLLIVAKQYQAESTNLTVQIKADYSDAAYATNISSMDEILSRTTALWGFSFDEAAVYGEAQYGREKYGWLETVTKEFAVKQKCKRLQFMFAGSHAEPLLIYGIGITYKKKKVKGNKDNIARANVVYPEE